MKIISHIETQYETSRYQAESHGAPLAYSSRSNLCDRETNHPWLLVARGLNRVDFDYYQDPEDCGTMAPALSGQKHRPYTNHCTTAKHFPPYQTGPTTTAETISLDTCQ